MTSDNGSSDDQQRPRGPRPFIGGSSAFTSRVLRPLAASRRNTAAPFSAIPVERDSNRAAPAVDQSISVLSTPHGGIAAFTDIHQIGEPEPQTDTHSSSSALTIEDLVPEGRPWFPDRAPGESQSGGAVVPVTDQSLSDAPPVEVIDLSVSETDAGVMETIDAFDTPPVGDVNGTLEGAVWNEAYVERAEDEAMASPQEPAPDVSLSAYDAPQLDNSASSQEVAADMPPLADSAYLLESDPPVEKAAPEMPPMSREGAPAVAQGAYDVDHLASREAVSEPIQDAFDAGPYGTSQGAESGTHGQWCEPDIAQTTGSWQEVVPDIAPADELADLFGTPISVEGAESDAGSPDAAREAVHTDALDGGMVEGEGEAAVTGGISVPDEVTSWFSGATTSGYESPGLSSLAPVPMDSASDLEALVTETTGAERAVEVLETVARLVRSREIVVSVDVGGSTESVLASILASLLSRPL